jgi:diguanylate cyclase (GGDEF)-like protein/PAS domain S-box-containing protein
VPDIRALALFCAPDGMYVLGPDRRILTWNARAQELTGFTAAEVLGRVCSARLLNHVDAEGRSLCGTRCPLRLTMRDGEPRRSTVFVHHRDGHLVPVEVRSAVMRTEAGVTVGAVEVFREATATLERDRRIEELELLASRDPLTALGNRRVMEQLLAEGIRRHDRDGAGFAALLVDLDRFKVVNDSHGHAAGDLVLRAVATTLDGAAPGRVVRFGGEEFLVLTPVTDADEAVRLAETLRRLVAAVRVPLGPERLSVTASIGVAVLTGGDTADVLLAGADRALLAAKARGRNRVLLVDAPA